ncbi:hypothetical protein CAEBREN_02511 [Caenorhabditis brenneri]|uniref:BZIP domain-containing protein n=1 Tax=Caenorhabditis brenneri TaxID=135651 RepID=G0N629_CAEBE|nr:hypothetical protein CAEBREN_02511 [Caenorhabditis brenneri]
MSNGVGNNFPGVPEYLGTHESDNVKLMDEHWIIPNEEVPGNNQVEPMTKDVTSYEMDLEKENDDSFDKHLDKEPLADAERSILGEAWDDDDVSEILSSKDEDPLLLDFEIDFTEFVSPGEIRDCEQMEMYSPKKALEPEVELKVAAIEAENIQKTSSRHPSPPTSPSDSYHQVKQSFKCPASLEPPNLPMIEKSDPLVLKQEAWDKPATPFEPESFHEVSGARSPNSANVPPGAPPLTASSFGPPAPQNYENSLAPPGSPWPYSERYGGSVTSPDAPKSVAPSGSPSPISSSYCSPAPSEYGSVPYLGSGPLTWEDVVRDNSDSSECVLGSSIGKAPRIRRCSRRHSTSFEGILGQKPTRCTKKDMIALSDQEKKERKKAQNARNSRSCKKRNEDELVELQEQRDSLKRELEDLEHTENKLWGEIDPKHHGELRYRRNKIAETTALEFGDTLDEKRKTVSDCLQELKKIEHERQFLTTRSEKSTNGSQKHRWNKRKEKAKTDLRIHELEEQIELGKKYQKLLKDSIDSRNSNSALVYNGMGAPDSFGGNPRMDDFDGNLSLENDAISQAKHPPVSDSLTILDISTVYHKTVVIDGTSSAPSVDRWPPISADP